MLHGIDGIDLVSFRVLGGAVLFWLTSFFTPRQHVPVRDIFLMAGAGLFALVLNQCSYTIGLSLTSPSNSSIMTTSMPIFAMILSFLILKEPITWKKAIGVMLGCSGAIIIILTSASASNVKVGNIWGDLLCITAQMSFALYLSLFKPLVARYSLFTLNKWMFTWASVFIWPFTFTHVADIDFAHVLAYICMMIGQKSLRPTVVSVYNYIQPIVAVTVSILAGLAILKPSQAVAAILVFTGVWLVVKSRAKEHVKN